MPLEDPRRYGDATIMAALKGRQGMNVFRSGGRFADSGGSCTLPDQVPAGQRLTLETVTGFYYGDNAVLGSAYLTVANRYNYAFPWVQCGSLSSNPSDRHFYGFNHSVRIYIDGPAALSFAIDGGSSIGGSSDTSGEYAVSGFLEPLA